MKRIVFLMGVLLLISVGTAAASRALSNVLWQRDCFGALEIVAIPGGNKVTCHESDQDPGPDPTSPPPEPTHTAVPTDPAPPPTEPPSGDIIALPGRLEAEDYREGGEGVGYHDTTPGNRGGQYRNDDVDIEACPKEGQGCFNVAYIREGEWLAYNVEFTESGTFVFNARVATRDTGRSLHIELDGVDITGPMVVPNTGGWQKWGNVASDPVQVDAGTHVLTIYADTRRFNVNYVDVHPSDGSPPPTPTDPPPGPTPTPTPEPSPGGYTDTFPEVGAAALGSCSAAVHDSYAVVGPDGNTYRTWHPIVDPSGCVFAHEHGDKPHPDAPLPPFGYVSFEAGSLGMIKAHAGFKIFTHYQNGNSGFMKPELDLNPSVNMDWMVAIHQGTAGAGRLTVPFHDFWFWSEHQGQETLVTVQANTGDGALLCGGPDPFPGRFIVHSGCSVYEQWIFGVNVGGAFSTEANFAVTNPVTYVDGSLEGGTLRANCNPNFSGEVPCEVSEVTGHSFFLGNMRTIHEPDWQWSNQGGATQFCTDPWGKRQDCGLANSILQTIPAVNLFHNGDIADRTANAPGFQTWQDPLWTHGVPGGN